MKKLLIISLLLLSSIFGNATKYYLSPSGNDTSGSGTIGSPWWTLRKVWPYLAAGDTVYFRGGTFSWTLYQFVTAKSGTAGNTIKLWAYPGESPIITRGVGFAMNNMISITYSNYIHIKGLEISNVVQLNGESNSSALMMQNCNNVILENIKYHHNASGAVLRDNSTNNLILNCDFHHNYDPYTVSDPYGNADGLNVSYIPVGATNTVRGCRFWNNSDDGIDLWNNDGYILIENCWSWKNGYREDGVTTGGDGAGFKLGVTTADYSSIFKRTVQNCVSFNNRVFGISQNAALCKMYIYNNTLFSNATGIYFTSSWGNQASVIRNNISYSNTTNVNISQSAPIVDHNSWNGGVTVTNADFVSVDTTGVSGSRQSDGSLPDLTFLKLAEGSDLIDAGINVGLPYSGSAPDLGAFEYTDVTDPTVTAFTIPATSTSLIVSVSSFTATDNVGVTGYLLTESATAPSPSEGLWSATAQSNYVFTTEGAKTLYAWAKDAAGNVSSSLNDSVTITVTPPTRVAATYHKKRLVYHKKVMMF